MFPFSALYDIVLKVDISEVVLPYEWNTESLAPTISGSRRGGESLRAGVANVIQRWAFRLVPSTAT
jgi:hypothetical protein